MTAAQAALIRLRIASITSNSNPEKPSRPVLTVAVARFLARQHGLTVDPAEEGPIWAVADRLIAMIAAHIMGSTQGQFARDGKVTWLLDERIREAFSDYLSQDYLVQGDHFEIEPTEQELDRYQRLTEAELANQTSPPTDLEPHDAPPAPVEAGHVDG